MMFKTCVLLLSILLLCVGWAEAGEIEEAFNRSAVICFFDSSGRCHNITELSESWPDVNNPRTYLVAGKDEPPGMDAKMGVLNLTQAELDTMQRKAKEQYGAEAYLRVMLIDPPCLAKMEAAMKAMEEYLRPPRHKFTGDETNWFEYRQILPGDKRRHDEGMLKWEASKKDCWQSGR